MLLKRNRKYTNVVAQYSFFPNVREFVNMTTTFAIVCLAWVFFRADNLNHAFDYIQRLFTTFANTEKPHISKSTLLFIGLLFGIEWIGRRNKYALETLFVGRSIWIRWPFYYMLGDAL